MLRSGVSPVLLSPGTRRGSEMSVTNQAISPNAAMTPNPVVPVVTIPAVTVTVT